MKTVHDLYLKKREGELSLGDYIYIWGISARWFACIWTLLSALFGILFARMFVAVDWISALYAIGVTQSLLLSSHFMNNYRDYKLGRDKDIRPEDVKDYTGASALVPLGITSVHFQRASMVAFIFLSAMFMYPLLFLDWWTQMLIMFFIGAFISLSYTDLFKPNGMGELGVFLGQCLGVALFCYVSQKPLELGTWWHSVFAMVPISFSGAFFYSIDQYQDAETDMTHRVRNWGILLFRSRLPLGLYILIGYTFVLFIQHVAITAGILPVISLIMTAPTWVIVMLIAAYVHVNREKALKFAVFAFIFMYPALMCLSLWVV